ncbi:hypothetical protein CXF85_18285 [Colwellia sp. 75C3]|uniref:hypothetical protein n=1 Tax=Colwellia sp. 75C3 TaxID=888425 RepID=UPI000C3227D3|nr:hypothetical protein [Colwellia sp. 75C3]PKG81417.1 hypothetical protein CXF85_18285 [Colwellia sp. 75C3]
MDDNSLEQRILRKADHLSKRLDSIKVHKKVIAVEKLLVISPIWAPILFAFICRSIFGGGTFLTISVGVVIFISYVIGSFALFRISDTSKSRERNIVLLLSYTAITVIVSFFSGLMAIGIMGVKVLY